MAFVPGVLIKLPPKSSNMVVLVTHAVLFAVVTSLVMRYYWTQVKGYAEPFGNYGPPNAPCPNGFAPGVNQGGLPDCVPVGRATYPGTAK